MRKEAKRSQNQENSKNVLYIGGSIILIAVIAFVIAFITYGNKTEESNLNGGKIATLVQESENNTKTTSTQTGKTVEEAKNEMSNTTNTVNSESNTKTKVENTTSGTTKKQTTTTKATTTKTTAKEQSNTTSTQSKETNSEPKEETQNTQEQQVTFIKPVEGEIVKEYASDNLVYSETLEEWTTHLGIDIKADKTTVVKSASAGKVKSIKNDPRYGLSVIIEHPNGYETLYSNLLSTEFVQVGEEVKQGQSIGTVGNTATFEIADDAHLHFEITKDGKTINPTELIK